jgi:hypothetical protein
MQELVQKLAALIGVPAEAAERLLLTLLGDLVRNSYQVELDAAERQGKLDERQAAERRRDRARVKLQRWKL